MIRPFADAAGTTAAARPTASTTSHSALEARALIALALITRQVHRMKLSGSTWDVLPSLDSCAARRNLPWGRMNRLFHRVGLTVGSALLALLAVTTALGAGSEVRTLPTDLITPLRLEPGPYQTRPAFLPRTTFTVDEGWYGAQETHSAWCVGTRRAPGRPANFRETLGAIRICANRLGPPYSTAISRFKALTTLTAGASKPIRVGGYPGDSFHAAVHGEHSLLPGIAPLIDLLPGGQQIFLNVRGKTVLLRIEISARTPGEATVRGFLRTMRFPP